ncbi:MAG TPA: MMPL family transporter [Ornithinimicrobium sp.]|uniref:MMPL family transporter n=1 Tax=Ornithinimicrobium sp. TaxID=1977084 RepID=UPI002B468B0E|nr:MMPL family transporter [Ornithinimicrobium sp.]HKJ11543.1 MMPL family transporter [Ornithinimicrobium sp.]
MLKLADTITSRVSSRVVAVVAILLAVGVLVGVGPGERSPSPTDTLAQGYGNTEGVELLDQLPADDTTTAIALFTVQDEDITARLGTLQQVVDSLTTTQGEEYPSAQVVPSDDGTAAIAVLTVPSATATDTSAEVTALRDTLDEEAPEAVTAAVTGPAAIEADLAAVFEGANFTLLLTTASVVAVLLLVTYRSPTLWLIPLTVIGLGDVFASTAATRVLEVAGVPWDESTTGILSVLVFGAGTDYALLLISRYRDELKRHESRHEAMALALRRTSEAVFASSSTVFLGLLTLLLSVFPTTRGLGLACAVGIVIAAGFALVLLPAVLVQFGRWVFWPLVPRVGQAALADGTSIWKRVGNAVDKRPPLFIAATVVVLALAAAGATRIDLGLPTNEQFLQEPEAISAAERLGESFPAGSADPTTIVTDTTDEQRLGQIQSAVESVDVVESVRPGQQEAGITTFQAVLSVAPSTSGGEQAVKDLRSALEDQPRTYVTGADAEALDTDEGTARDRVLILPLILGLVLVALFGLLRSFLAPVILVSTVLLTYLSALGISWLLFTTVFGFSGLDSGVPLLAFLFLVALGVDYNIFLITRALEESAVVGARDGILRGLAATGGVITSAGILLAAVFAALGVLPLVVLAQLGVVIFVGVLIDTLVVRTVLVPAIVLTLGETFYWPRRLRRGKHTEEAVRDADDEHDEVRPAQR